MTLAQQRALVTLPKVTGFCSVVGSALIVFVVARDKQKRAKPYHRLVAGISCVDISSSFWLALSTWPIPAESGVLWASGTTQTCSLQGFFTQFGISSSIYNASLSTYYLLVIRYGWKEDRIRTIEPYLHLMPIFWGMGTAIAGLPLTLFNNANLWCWIAPFPQNCDGNTSVECTRGANADIYRWAFFYGPLWVMILIVTTNVVLIQHYVRSIERRGNMHRSASVAIRAQNASSLANNGKSPDHSARRSSTWNSGAFSRSFHTPNQTASSLKYTKRVARQCFWYAAAFYLNWTALTIVRVMQTSSEKAVPFALLLIASMTTPRQGLPNFLVYLGPRFFRARRKSPVAGVWKWLALAPEMETEREPSQGVEEVHEHDSPTCTDKVATSEASEMGRVKWDENKPCAMDSAEEMPAANT